MQFKKSALLRYNLHAIKFILNAQVNNIWSIYIIVSINSAKIEDMASLSIPHYFLEFSQVHVHWVGGAIQTSHSLSSPSSPAFNLSQHQGLFQWVSSSHQMAKVLELTFSISPSNEYSELISFRIDWFDLLQSKGISGVSSLKELKASILHCSAFFKVQLPHPYMTSGKTMALTIQTFAGKVISLLFNTLSRFVIAFLPRRKCILLSWLQSPSVVILEPKKIKSVTVSIFPPSIYHEVMEPDAMILVFWILSFRSAFHSLLSPSSRVSLLLFTFCH